MTDTEEIGIECGDILLQEMCALCCTGVESAFGATMKSIHIEPVGLRVCGFLMVSQYDMKSQNIRGMKELRTPRFAKEVPKGRSIFCITRKATSESNDGDGVGVRCPRVASLGAQKVRHD